LTRSASRRRAFARIFAVPALLAVLMAVGLTSGVLGDGIWDVISWLALGTPLVVIAYHLAR
jgi:hypothetical protein